MTTFDTLRAMGRPISETPLSLVIVDEAQYVKNAGTQRHRNVRAQVERADRAILLSGTPLENRVQDFTTLVSLLDPQALPDGRHRSPAAFRQAVAPVYLRRNQEDVLTELPEQV
ncbi:SNF2-related protein, partial [Micrococcus sp. F3Y]|uniref:SNF2-related protein n=1 Tax=Micrococcus sp. F3Y TaxID=3402627 RepID=UPI003AF7ADD4